VTTALQDEPAASSTHWPCLAVGLGVMLGGTLYPPLMTTATGRADHALATFLFWAMSAGFVRGVGFIPRATVWRWLFSSWACVVALAIAGLLKLLQPASFF
jgi:predicted membrane protein